MKKFIFTVAIVLASVLAINVNVRACNTVAVQTVSTAAFVAVPTFTVVTPVQPVVAVNVATPFFTFNPFFANVAVTPFFNTVVVRDRVVRQKVVVRQRVAAVRVRVH